MRDLEAVKLENTDAERMAAKVHRLIKWHSGNPAPPYKIDLEPALGCNLKCRFCWRFAEDRLDKNYYSSVMPEERFIELVHEAYKLEVREWQLAGGWEPMVNPELTVNLMYIIKSYNMYGCLTTNGTLFSPADIETLVRIGWDEILFSLEAPDAPTHDYLVGASGAFEKCIEALRQFQYWKRKLASQVPRIGFHTVLCNRNYDRLAGLFRLAHAVGVDGVNVEPIIVWSPQCADLQLSTTQETWLRARLNALRELADKLSIATNIESFNENSASKVQNNLYNPDDNGLLRAPCFEPWLSMEIRVVGHAVPCRVSDDKSGPYLQERTLREIWFGEYFDSIRTRLIEGKPPDYCTTCSAALRAEATALRQSLRECIKSTK